jgi:hypothetical protein
MKITTVRTKYENMKIRKYENTETWKYENMKMRKHENTKIWKCGNMEMQNVFYDVASGPLYIPALVLFTEKILYIYIYIRTGLYDVI